MINAQSECMRTAESYNAQHVAESVWEALLSAGAFIEGEFVFASGHRSTLKTDAERLMNHPRQLGTILGHYVEHPCFSRADVILYVADGMRDFSYLIEEAMTVPVAHTKRKPGATSKYEYVYTSPQDRELAQSANRPRIAEDIVSTLGSVAGTRRLLRPHQDVHSLSMLARNPSGINPDYRMGLVDHYLLERHIPTTKTEFDQRLGANQWD